jgi:hypothetical protein
MKRRHVAKFLMEEGMKGTEIIDRLNKHYARDALRRTQVYFGIKDVKSGRKDLSNTQPPGRVLDEGLDSCIKTVLKDDLRF